jgi:hypothetical protein
MKNFFFKFGFKVVCYWIEENRSMSKFKMAANGKNLQRFGTKLYFDERGI